MAGKPLHEAKRCAGFIVDQLAPADPAALCLPVLNAREYGALEENELVARRLAELQAADLQQDARDAARRGDWPAVRQSLARVRELAQNHQWLTRVVAELETLAAQEDRERFSKEVFYSAASLRERLASVNESAGPSTAPPAAPYLRRKSRAGKAQS
jgi:Ca-activated chloride channel homolog